MGGRIGLQGYVRILATIKRTPMGALELANTFGVQSTSMNDLMRAMMALSLAHIADWTPAGTKHLVRRPMYLMGDAPSVPNPITRAGKPTRHLGAVDVVALRHRVNLIALKALIDAIKKAPRSNSELAALTGMHDERQRHLIELMHSLRMIRVPVWRRSKHGPPVPLYQWGDGYNAPRPAPIPWQHYDRLRTLKRRAQVMGPAASSVRRANVSNLFPCAVQPALQEPLAA